MKRMNKKGAEMTIGTIVIIVLAIAVLVFLIFGFTTGWNNLWERIGIYSGAGSNIHDVATVCAAACAQNNVHGWNNQVREVRNEDKFVNKTATCDELAKGVNLYKKGAKPSENIPLAKGIIAECPRL